MRFIYYYLIQYLITKGGRKGVMYTGSIQGSLFHIKSYIHRTFLSLCDDNVDPFILIDKENQPSF